MHRCTLKVWWHICFQSTSTQTERVIIRNVSDVFLVLQTHSEQWLKQMCGCVNMLSLIFLSLFSPTISTLFSVLYSMCMRHKRNRGERYWGRVFEQCRAERSSDRRTTASRTAWSKPPSAWPFGCGSSATLISIQIKVGWSAGLSLLVV